MKHTLRGGSLIVVATVLVAGAAGGALLAAPQAPDAAQKTVWQGVYTSTQAASGAITYGMACANCHGDMLEGGGGNGTAKALTGDTFWGDYQGQMVGDLLAFMGKNMPNNAPGSLDASAYVDLTAFILSRNEIPAGNVALSAETAPAIEIIPKDGKLKPLPASTAALVIGCLAKGGDSGWLVNMATAPVRMGEGGKIPDSAASRPLGDRSTPLLYVLTSLDQFVGHRVWVKGILVGDGGSMGINVTDVGSLADTCM
jgi:mono/diheme cytochrome c family protein